MSRISADWRRHLARTALAERMREEAGRPFDLGREPALRASLLRTADDEHFLLVTMHHIASDGWSMTVFWRELAELCDGYRRGEVVRLLDLPVHYRDYAAWQRELLSGAATGPAGGLLARAARGPLGAGVAQ